MEGVADYGARTFDVTNLPDETDRLLTVDSANVRWLWKQAGTLVMLSKPHNQSLGVSNGQNLVVSLKVDDAGRGGILRPVNTDVGRFVARSLVNNKTFIETFGTCPHLAFPGKAQGKEFFNTGLFLLTRGKGG